MLYDIASIGIASNGMKPTKKHFLDDISSNDTAPKHNTLQDITSNVFTSNDIFMNDVYPTLGHLTQPQKDSQTTIRN
jgi:hypothetical protein